MKATFFDRLINRLDHLDKGSLQSYFLSLAREKGLMETIFQALAEGIIVLDPKAHISFVNRSAEKFLGFDSNNALGEPIARYLKEIQWDLVLDLDEVEWNQLARREIEITYPQRRFLEFYVVPLSTVEESEDGAVVILRDVTQERESTAESVESEKLHALSLLAAGVAHEIGNPLNSIHINLQLLKRELDAFNEKKDTADLMELVDVSQREVTRLDEIIRQFLKALRPSIPDRKPHRLKVLMEDTLKVLKHEIEDRSILIEKNYAGEVPPILVDETQVKQTFFNIIKNALQAMSDGGILEVETGINDRFAWIAIEDNGCGMDSEKLGAIYEPYKTSKTEGTGLGMMIVQRIMRDHGGEMAINSEVGKGTRIILRFPIEDARLTQLGAPKKRGKNG